MLVIGNNSIWSFINLIYWVVWFSQTIHPNQWTVTELRSDHTIKQESLSKYPTILENAVTFWTTFYRCYETIILLLQSYSFSNRRILRSSHPELFRRKGILKMYNKFTGEHPCQSVISIKLLKQLYKFTGEHPCTSYCTNLQENTHAEVWFK